jgi:hypothetical protein
VSFLSYLLFAVFCILCVKEGYRHFYRLNIAVTSAPTPMMIRKKGQMDDQFQLKKKTQAIKVNKRPPVRELAAVGVNRRESG